MTELIVVVTITLLAVISPGPDFAMVTRNSLMLSRRSGVLTALGIGLGVTVHVSYTLLGVGLLIMRRVFRPGARAPESTEAFSLHEFRKMRDSGKISDEEYESLRQSLLAGLTPPKAGENRTSSPGGDRDDEK